MPRSRVTLADLKQRLRERVGDTSTFWNDVEARDALNEAIAVWQALSGEWTTRITIPAQSDSPSFYPVAKQIVSLTRVSVADSNVPLPPLRLRIGATNVFRTKVNPPVYHTATEVLVVWNSIPVNGVGPYKVTWVFPPQFDLETGSTLSDRAPKGRFTAQGTYTVTCSVVDAADDTASATFQLLVTNPTIGIGGPPTPVPPS